MPTAHPPSRPRPRAALAWAACLCALAGATPAGADVDVGQFHRDLQALATPRCRTPGSPGYDETVKYLQAQMGKLPRVQLRAQRFPVMVPVTLRADLILSDDSTQQVYPFWPAGVRVNSTAPQGVRGRLVYAGACGFEEINPAAMAGQIAVIEAAAADRWTRACSFGGAAAIIVLGSPDVSNDQLRPHDLTLPINCPRFYLPPGDLAVKLRHNAIPGEATLLADVRWERRWATNLYALVNPPPLPVGSAPLTPASALMFSVPLDASGLVPDLAAGASQAAQAAAGLALVRDLSRAPLPRPVVVFFGGADSLCFQASRTMFMTFADPPAAAREQLAKLRPTEVALARDLARARAVADDPRQLDATRDRALIERVATIVETDAARDQDALFRLRLAGDTRPAAARRAGQLERAQVAYNALRFAIRQEPARLGEHPDEALQALADAGPPDAQVDPETADLARALPPPWSAVALEWAQWYLRRAAIRMGGTPDGRFRGLAQDYADRREELETRVALYRWLAEQLRQDPDPDPRTNSARLIELLVALDLSDGGSRVGPLDWGQFLRASTLPYVQDYRDWFEGQERDYFEHRPGGAWYAPLRNVIDLEPLTASKSPQSYLCASMPIGSELCTTFGVPGLTLMTLDDLRQRRDTPADTADYLDDEALVPQLRAVRALMWRAWSDPRFAGHVEVRRQHESIEGQVVGLAPGRPVPDLPRPGFLATYYHANEARFPRLTPLPWTLGVRRTEVRACDAEGRYRFEGLSKEEGSPRPGNTELHKFAVQVYRVAPGGAITAASDLGPAAGDLRWYVDLKQEPTPLRSLVFDCAQVTVLGLHDPRNLQALDEAQLIDARRDAEPQRYNLLLQDEMLAAFVEPGAQRYLTARYGRAGNRLVLANVADPATVAGIASAQEAVRAASGGFAPGELAGLSPLAEQTARDLWRLDEVRLSRYAAARVRSAPLDAAHARAADDLLAAAAARRAGDGLAAAARADAAWAEEADAYRGTQDLANDVVRGAVFLLLLCIPFSFCAERLLIASAGVYRQVAGVLGVFAAMAVGLWSFHPAFRISSSPLIVILAFAIILMSSVVIAVVYGKFHAELRRSRDTRGTAEAASFARASVLASAVQLGIANMRRRPFRTALTSATVVLITFAVLCFTSAARYPGATAVPTGTAASHPGILVRQRGYRPLPPGAADELRAAVGRDVRPVERWWALNAAETREMTHVIAAGPIRAPIVATRPADARAARLDAAPPGGSFAPDPAAALLGLVELPATMPSHDEPPPATRPTSRPARFEAGMPRVFAARAVLGLSPGESELSPIRRAIGADKYGVYKFDWLEQDPDAKVIYFSAAVARALRVREWDWVRVGGIDLQVAGLFDAATFDREVRTLGGEPLAPLNYQFGGLDAGGRRLDDSAGESLDLGGATAEPAGATYEHLAADQFVIVPAAVAQRLPNATLREVAFRTRDGADARRRAESLARRFAFAVLAGEDDGVKLVSAASLTSVSGAGEVAVPLAIAALIIFNTMMGSIAERRREIHVYTSLGLAPLHVGALFLAEAMTYGLIGTVFGYVIGQAAGTLFLKLGWLGGVTLNYSGTSAMATMGLILLVVLLSALVPARLASQVAAPSAQRHWRVPEPHDGVIRADLPFTINQTAADGAIAYLAEYFDAHREGSIGKFSAERVAVYSPRDGNGNGAGDPASGLRGVVWLTPFDLGIRQEFTLRIYPGAYRGIYEVQVLLRRLSGDDGNWHRLNRAFLGELRKQFLQWRSLTPQRMLEYVDASRELFGTTPPVTGPSPV